MTPAQTTTARVYRGRSGPERHNDREARLVATAFELFGREGYALVTGDRLASAAGVTGRNLYQDHGGKEGVFIALYRRLFGEALSSVSAALDASDPSLWTPEGQLRVGVWAYVHYLTADAKRLRILAVESVGISEAVDDVGWEACDAFAVLIAGRIALLPSTEGLTFIDKGWTTYTLLRVRVWILLAHELIVGWTREESPPEVDTVVDDIVSVGLCLAGRPPA